ncbi:MAG: hypothetical protein C0491_04590 [Novosphingobium sp.]|nr:hypothetical protein [Novosphingobium sp.]
MPRLAAKFEAGNYAGAYRAFGLSIDRRLELAALEATDQAAKIAVRSIRDAMAGAGLGRLGNGLGAASDLSSGRGIHRREAGGWSASGIVFVRSRSERTRGALEAYTAGAEIAPKRGRWLWIATPDIQRLAGGKGRRQRVTPGNWDNLGLDRRIGPLVQLKSVNGYPLLAVQGAGVSLTGAKGSARSLRKNGQARRGQVRRELLIAFVAIPRTSRAARVDVNAILAGVQADLPRLFREACERTKK